MSDEAVVDPVEIPAEQAAPETSGESAPESAAGENEPNPEGEQKPHKGGFQRRIDRLTRDKSIAEQERDHWRDQALRTQPKEQPQEPKPVQADAKPLADKFETAEEYLEALADWKLEQREKVRETKQQEQQVQSKQQENIKAFDERQSAFRAANPDYDEVVMDLGDVVDLSKSPLTAEIVEHEHGPELAYFLAQNPDIATRLAAMTPTQIAREIGRLESRFVPSADAPADVPTPPVTKAPPPPRPVRAPSQTATKDPGEMEPHEYREWRRKQFPNL